MQVLPALGNIPSEAKLNLVIYHLRAGRLENAHALIQDLQPTMPHEYILKVGPQLVQVLMHAVVHCASASVHQVIEQPL